VKLTTRVLLALVAGLAVGSAVAAARNPTLLTAVSWLEPAGALWVNAIRMTIVPLVVSLLVVGVASGDSLRTVGRLGGSALLLFLGILIAAGLFSALVSPALLAPLEVDAAAATALRANAASTAGDIAENVRRLPSVTQRILELVPANPIRAAVDGAMLPLVVFTLAFAAALARVPLTSREPVVGFFRGVADAMIVLVGWAFVVAPIGVFALGATLAARLGIAAAGAVGWFVLVFSAILAAFTVLLYPLAVVGGRVGLKRFAAAVAPVQALAFSSRSSAVAMPAMITAAREKLGLPAAVVSLALPLAVTVFRVSTPLGWPVSALFLAELYGVQISTAQLASLIATSILISYSVPPIPSGSLFLIAPVLVGMGIPAEGAGILIAVDAIPDLFKTTVNATSHVTAATVLARTRAAAQDQAWTAATPTPTSSSAS
jgi:proton glutamate symport protein